MRIRIQEVVAFLALVATQASIAFAQPSPPPESEVQLTSSALTYAVNFARTNPQVTFDQRKAVAQKAFEFIREKAAKGLDLKSPDDLYKEFAMNPNLMKGWNKTSDGKRIKDPQLGRLISEFNLLISQLNAEKVLGNCKDFKRNLGPTLMEGTCTVCGCREGYGWDKNLYLTWVAKDNKPVKTPQKKNSKSGAKDVEPPKRKEYNGWMPGFAFGKNVEDLIAVGELGTYFASSARAGDPFAPSLDELKAQVPEAKTPEDLGSYAMMSEFRENVYKRAMMSGIQSQLSNEIQFSDKYLGKTPDEIGVIIQKRVDEEVTKQCQHCPLSATFDKDIREKLKNVMRSDIQSGSAMPFDSRTVSAQLCKDLKAAQYQFDPEYKDALHRAYLSGNGGKEPKGGLHNSQFDNASNSWTSAKLGYDRQRRKVLSSIVQSSAAGKLMLTKAMTWLDGTNPGSTKLKCEEPHLNRDGTFSEGSVGEDAALIVKAQQEAYEAGNKFTTKLNDNVHPNDYSLKTFNSDLITLLKIAPHPFGQAVLLSSSAGASAKFACDLIQVVSDRDVADAWLDDALLWGTIGLTVLSLGTLSPLSMAGLAVNAAIGTTAATVSLVQANAALKNANNYRTWSIAQDFDPYLRQMSQKEFDRYNSLVTAAVIGYGFTVLDLNALVMKWVSKGDTMAQALKKGEDLLKQPPEKIYTEVLSTEAEVAIGGGRVLSKEEGKALYKAAAASDVQAARTILKEAGFAEAEIPKILAKRVREEASIIVEKPVIKELEEVVVQARPSDRRAIANDYDGNEINRGTKYSESETPYGTNNQRQLMSEKETNDFFKASYAEQKKTLQELGIESRKGTINVSKDGVSREIQVIELDLDNVASNSYLTNYINDARKISGKRTADASLATVEKMDDLRVVVRTDDDMMRGGYYDPDSNTVVLSRSSFNHYLRTGRLDRVKAHELGHYLISRNPNAPAFYRMETVGSRAPGYADGLVNAEELTLQVKDMRNVGTEFADDFKASLSNLSDRPDVFELQRLYSDYSRASRVHSTKALKIKTMIDETHQMAAATSTDVFTKSITKENLRNGGKKIEIPFTLLDSNGKAYTIRTTFECASCSKIATQGSTPANIQAVQKEITDQLKELEKIAQVAKEKTERLYTASQQMAKTIRDEVEAVAEGKTVTTNIKAKLEKRIDDIQANSISVTNEFNKATAPVEKSLDGSIIATKPSVERIEQHVVKPETTTRTVTNAQGEAIEKTYLVGGMHTQESLDEFLRMRPDLADKISKETLSNGVVKTKLPKKGVFTNSLDADLPKTLFPAHWDEAEIKKAILYVTKNNKPVARTVYTKNGVTTVLEDYEAIYKGVNVRAYTKNKTVLTGYPADIQPGTTVVKIEGKVVEDAETLASRSVGGIESTQRAPQIRVREDRNLAINAKMKTNASDASIKTMMEKSPVERVFKSNTLGGPEGAIYVEFKNKSIAVFRSNELDSVLGSQTTKNLNDGSSISVQRTIEVDGKSYSGSVHFVEPSPNGVTNFSLVEYAGDDQIKNWLVKEVATDPQQAAAWTRFEERVKQMNLTGTQKKQLLDDAFAVHSGGVTGTYSKDKLITEFKLKLQDPKNPYRLSPVEAKSISKDLGDNWVLGAKPKPAPLKSEGIGKVDFSKNYFGTTNILSKETQPDRVWSFREAFMKGKMRDEMRIEFQLGPNGTWQSDAYVIGYDKSKGIVRVKIGSDPRNTMVLDEHQLMTAKEVPLPNGKFYSKELKGERFAFEREPDPIKVVETKKPDNTVTVNTEKPNGVTAPKTNEKVSVNDGPVTAEIKTSTGTYRTTHKQDMAYQTWKTEKAKNHPAILLNDKNSGPFYLDQTGKSYLNASDKIDLLKVRALDGQVVEFKNAVYLERTGLTVTVEVDGVKKTFYWREVIQLDGKGVSIKYTDPKPFQLEVVGTSAEKNLLLVRLFPVASF